MKKPTPAQLAARARFAEMARSGAFKRKAKAKSNPRKKTVSQKISQLVHEGYPQKQAVAVALSEQRKRKVKRNPATGHKGSRVKLNPVKYRDIAKGVAPARVQYAVHWPDRPSYHAMAYFTKKADAVEVARDVSDRLGKPVAVSRVQIHFGPM